MYKKIQPLNQFDADYELKFLQESKVTPIYSRSTGPL